MNEYYIEEMKSRITQLEAAKKKHSQRLSALKEYDDVFLKISKGPRGNYYYVKTSQANKYTYLGNRDNKEVLLIQENRFLHQLVSDVDSELTALKSFLAHHLDTDNASVCARLPKAYQNSSNTWKISDDKKVLAWKEAKEAIKGSRNQKYTQNLIMRASDGTPMRSKSEVIIANLLISHEIPFVYELPHIINGITVYPDFTVLSTRDYETEFLIEHQGLMNQPDYQRQFLNKLNTYLKADIIPGKNIFFTFDDLNGGFDPAPVIDIINTHLK